MEIIQANKIYDELCKTTFVHKPNGGYNILYNVLNFIWDQNSMNEDTKYYTENCARKIMVKMYDFYNDSEAKFDLMEHSQKWDIFLDFAYEKLDECK
ncbi:MAG: hypothetical protein PHZ17_04055 [Sulfurovum sp.]|nr:hypothetical protein [Sulfurovum sp.]